MADSNNVYKRITNWNMQIIQPINELAENPPDGCDPVNTLDEAEKDHLWMKQDIIDVQDKLMEICPDNNFTELETPQLVTVILIQEIEDAIDHGWCLECDITTIEWELGSWSAIRESGTSDIKHCCNIEIEYKYFLWYYTGWDWYKYTSPYYDTWIYSDSNTALMQIIQDTYWQATYASVEWAKERQKELTQQAIVEQKAEELKSKRATLEILQLQLAACTENCGSIQIEINQIEDEISQLEDEIQEAKQKRDEAKAEAENQSTIADTAAAANWGALSGLKSWDPNTFNIQHLIGGISSEWGVGKYPSFYYRISTWGVGYERSSGLPGTIPSTGNAISGKFTHNGLPYAKSGSLIWSSYWVKRWQIKHCCGMWDVIALGCIYGECEDYGDEQESTSDLPSTQWENATLKLKAGYTPGTKPTEDYNPDPDA